jgi:acyl carrier protein
MHENIDDEFDPDEDNLIDMMDSVSFMQLVVFIEQDLDVRLDMSMMGLESFANINALLETLDQHALEH